MPFSQMNWDEMKKPIMRKNLQLASILFLLIIGIAARAQNIRYIGVESGLSNNSVTSIYKDVYGFMWLGTYDGLNKYDGNSFSIYRNIWGDHNSLIDNHINQIAGIGRKIFIGTLKGLVYFDYEDSGFHPVTYADSQTGQVRPINYNITSLSVAESGTLFIGTDVGGLFVYDPQNKTAHQVEMPGKRTSYYIQATTSGRTDGTYIFIRNFGLCKLGANNKKIVVVSQELKSARAIAADGQNNVWIGTDNGLYKYHLLTGKKEHVFASNSKLSSANVTDIKLTKSRQLLIGTDGGGTYEIDTAGNKVSNHYDNNSSPALLKSDAVSMLYLDDSMLWITTLRGGINIIDHKPNRFETITHNLLNTNSVVNNFSLSFCEDERNNLWIGTDGGGLSYWDRSKKLFTNYIHQEKRNSIAGNFITSIVNDHSGQIWIGMFNGGIDRFDKRSGTFIHYSCLNKVTGTEDKNIWKLYLDSRNRLWAGTVSGGALFCYDRIKDKFEIFDNRLTNVHAICEDHAANIWFGNRTKLIKMDSQTKKYDSVVFKNAIHCIAEDKHQHIWIGTEGGGLIRYDPIRHNIKRFTQQDGLPNNSILNVVVDNKGNVWGSTYNGLTEFDDVTQKFKNYFASDGLQSNQFNFNAAAKLQTGELIFGGINGFNLFHPDSIRQESYQPEIRLVDLKVNNKSVTGDSLFTGVPGVAVLKEITLPYLKGTIAIDYTAPEYTFADKLKYAYYLEGWDHGWNYVGNLRTAYYTRLNEGQYKLHVRVSDTDGNWNRKELLLEIRILPPWYRAWWAYVLYVICLGSVFYGFSRYRIRQNHLRLEVKFANLQVEREKELNEKKLSFFTNIAHEFRTPLTLIINPVKDMIKARGSDENNDLTTIYRNSRRLLGLIDHLLLFRKTESENDTLNLRRINFPALCKDVFLCFAQQARARKIRYEYHCSNEDLVLFIDREKIEIAIFNLISNALKFTPENGSIELHIDETEESVCLEISDSGCGIPEATGEKLFDKFYQVKDHTSLKTGFGIGLYLVKTFVENHEGKISFRRNEQGGTTFTINLPRTETSGGGELDDENDQHLIGELNSMEDEEANVLIADEASLGHLISDRQSIIIIDDNREMRAYIKKIFNDTYQVYEAETAEAGLEMIKKQLPDVVISDIMLPGINGLELCQRIKTDPVLSHIPVILMTGDSFDDIRLQGLEEGAVDFLSKPFDKDLLVARVKGIIKNRVDLQHYFFNEVTFQDATKNFPEVYKKFIDDCVKVIEEHLLVSDLDVKTIAEKMGCSYSTLYKKIKQFTGMSLNGFIRLVRLRKAAELLIMTDANVNEVAYRCGYNDSKYFRRHFSSQFGLTPSEYIKKHRTSFRKGYSMNDVTPQNFTQILR